MSPQGKREAANAGPADNNPDRQMRAGICKRPAAAAVGGADEPACKKKKAVPACPVTLDGPQPGPLHHNGHTIYFDLLNGRFKVKPPTGPLWQRGWRTNGLQTTWRQLLADLDA